MPSDQPARRCTACNGTGETPMVGGGYDPTRPCPVCVGVGSRVADPADWQAPNTAPTDGKSFLAELSNGWVVILYATEAVRRRHRYSWWGGKGVAIPYEPTHPKDQDWDGTMRLTGWQPLPKSRQQMAWDADDASDAT